MAFVTKFRVDAEMIAKQLHVPTENILGLAAEETQYGQGRIAKEHNNYFSMHAPAPLQAGEAPVQGAINVKVATYLSFLQSGKSFAARFGSAVYDKEDPNAFAQALMRSGYNSGDPRTGGRAGFERYLVDIIGTIKARMSC
ncbi:glucosaminidase domain-containing protein [Telmatospirillum sp.]|uniref:glucosaminidase domain-containing protein n=1 Tax=Telmatospirillum sp. TaxID=2079197 RepID=UPI00284C9B8E|nr:glucosaminidase domain-containing protein [Telmatospirillum sp.]MDR3441350.1 hypothetical protein [Telmatospirillum sp.]